MTLVQKYKLAILFWVTFLLITCFSSFDGTAQNVMQCCESCKYWQEKIDPSIKLPEETTELNEKDNENVLAAIECLLQMNGRKSQSKFPSGVINVIRYGEMKLPSPTVEVAALYYVSYLYYQNWRHANFMVLWDKEGKKNTKESIETAYKAYQSWFEKVKEIGLDKAREQKLDPLNGTDVRWY